MSEEKKEYTVCLEKNQDCHCFIEEMCNESCCEHIPDRCVKICQRRPGADDITDFFWFSRKPIPSVSKKCLARYN